ncbi:probable palmitoyltransferase ZDHHC24 [Episyrphus balteatus]|uniref:probable palmitoyltransferase ZDHHC24 n=1 Tax=Episyrphus balteatus TaxID=286459 RepID=UPI0024851BD4|nr:probable palmitoyltransferase ZDHHC24 [Episyrphus balteatus]
MRLRKNFLPRTLADIWCFLLIATFIPITFVFELTIVLPEFHDFGGLFYWITLIAGVFLIMNIKGNMLACMLVDTSIKNEILIPPTDPDERKLWRMCSVCETMAPPRSWHCNTCKTCILKRDHHCFFTGCCVGHRNHRYFLMFLIFLIIGSLYTTIYNSIYLWYLHTETYANYFTLFKMVFPMLMFTVDSSWTNFYLLIYELNVIAFAYSLVLFVYHGQIILRGGVIHERSACKYDLGWKKNLEMVLGTKMHKVWLSPFVESPLPHDGINWQGFLKQTPKNR